MDAPKTPLELFSTENKLFCFRSACVVGESSSQNQIMFRDPFLIQHIETLHTSHRISNASKSVAIIAPSFLFDAIEFRGVNRAQKRSGVIRCACPQHGLKGRLWTGKSGKGPCGTRKRSLIAG